MTTRMTLTNQSPLGSASQFYQVKKQSQGSILDIPNKGLLELYPAGYTKMSYRDNISRQDTYKRVYELAVQNTVEDQLFPFGKDDHNIELVPDPESPYDTNAIHVILRTSGGPLAELNGKDLGFIPRKINQNILQHIELIHGGRIYKVRANFHKKYYTAKVVFGYGANTFGKLSLSSMARFASILEE